jgi:hypothetical protein
MSGCPVIGQTAVNSSCHLDAGDARVLERLQPGIVLGAGMPERDELFRRASVGHGRTLGACSQET